MLKVIARNRTQPVGSSRMGQPLLAVSLQRRKIKLFDNAFRYWGANGAGKIQTTLSIRPNPDSLSSHTSINRGSTVNDPRKIHDGNPILQMPKHLLARLFMRNQNERLISQAYFIDTPHRQPPPSDSPRKSSRAAVLALRSDPVEEIQITVGVLPQVRDRGGA